MRLSYLQFQAHQPLYQVDTADLRQVEPMTFTLSQPTQKATGMRQMVMEPGQTLRQQKVFQMLSLLVALQAQR